jgi:hypothetical protein
MHKYGWNEKKNEWVQVNVRGSDQVKIFDSPFKNVAKKYKKRSKSPTQIVKSHESLPLFITPIRTSKSPKRFGSSYQKNNFPSPPKTSFKPKFIKSTY